MEKEAKKLQLVKDTHELWDKLKKVLNDLYCIKQSLSPLMNTNDEIILQEMPPMEYKYFKNKGTNDMIETLNPIISIIKTDVLMVQKAIWNLEQQFDLEKKTFEVPNLDFGKEFFARYKKLELVLESCQEEIKFIELEKEKKEQVENLTERIETGLNISEVQVIEAEARENVEHLSENIYPSLNISEIEAIETEARGNVENLSEHIYPNRNISEIEAIEDDARGHCTTCINRKIEIDENEEPIPTPPLRQEDQNVSFL